MNQATTALATASGEVINSHDQFEVSKLYHSENISLTACASFVGLQRSPSCMFEFPVCDRVLLIILVVRPHAFIPQ